MPASTNTRRVLRRELYDQVPSLGFYGTADSVAAGSITDTYALQDTNLSTDQYRGAYIYRPDRTGDDLIKKAGALTVATGVLAHTGSNYSNTSDLVYEIVGLIHPDELNACITRAIKKVYFETQAPLTVLTDVATEGATAGDGDMSSSGIASWAQVGTCTRTKVTDAYNVWSGIRALRCANGAANSGAESINIRVHPSDPVFVSTVCRVDTGTARLRLWDATNAAEIRSYTNTREGWCRMWVQETVPSTCEEITVRLLGTGASDDIYWDHVVVTRMYDRRIFAPSWLNEPWKFLKLREARYTRNLADHIDDANSRILGDWYTPQQFSIDPFNPEANAFAVQLNKPLPIADLWIDAKRPYSDLESLAADTDTTTTPYFLIIAYAKLELADLLMKRYPTDTRWQVLRAEGEKEVRMEAQSRPETPAQPKRYMPSGRI